MKSLSEKIRSLLKGGGNAETNNEAALVLSVQFIYIINKNVKLMRIDLSVGVIFFLSFDTLLLPRAVFFTLRPFVAQVDTIHGLALIYYRMNDLHLIHACSG